MGHRAHLCGQHARRVFVQGYNAARDRLWQIDLWRKRGLGLLARDFGPEYVEQDRAARLFLFRGDMEQEWASYAPGTREASEAFVEGINAYVRSVRDGQQPLPIEFRELGTAPELWAADDIVRIRTNVSAGNVASEVTRARITAIGGVEADAWRWPLEPEHARVVPEGLDPSIIPADVLKTYHLAHAPVRFERWNGPSPVGAEGEGSNCWAVAPARTATGRPLLANDPHRLISAPSLRYVVHLEAPGLSVIGAGEPALPGIALGHNGHIAWGLTIFNLDQEDLYVYDLDRENPQYYCYGDSYEPARVEIDRIEVRGEAPREVVHHFTRHGPVVHRTECHAFAVRLARLEPGSCGYLASSWLWRARCWSDFLAARNRWRAPALNLLYADVSGNIGWAVAGAAPVRPNWDGLMPVPGDGSYEWKGFHDPNALPNALNPACGWIASANEMNIPEAHQDKKLSFEWPSRARFERIEQVLDEGDPITVTACAGLQTDTVNMRARKVIELLASLQASSARVKEAASLLRNWDCDERRDSRAAAIYQVWTSRHLVSAVLARTVSPETRKLIAMGSLDVAVSALSSGGALEASKNSVLEQSLINALDELEQLLGPDSSSWSWGALHQVEFVHPFAAAAPPPLKPHFESGRFQIGGSGDTPAAAAYADDCSVNLAGALRMVFDVGDWDSSVFASAPGQSGDPLSAHFRDQVASWVDGKFQPLSYSTDAVSRHTRCLLALEPE